MVGRVKPKTGPARKRAEELEYFRSKERMITIAGVPARKDKCLSFVRS